MYSTSEAFKQNVTDGTSPQNFLLVFGDAYFSANDGDFTTEGVTINDYLFTGDEITYGECPSSTISFELNNPKKNMNGLSFGECKAYIGVLTDTEEYTMAGNCHIEVNGKSVDGTSTELDVDGTKVYDGGVISLISDGNYVYAYTTTDAVIKFDKAFQTASTLTAAYFMRCKLASPKSYVFESNILTSWTNGAKETWEYCPMGVYDITRPSRMLKPSISIPESYDRMQKFDADCSAFLSGLTYPLSAYSFYSKLCTAVGVPFLTETVVYWDKEITSSTFSAVTVSTYRDLLYYVLELGRRNAKFNRDGVLELRNIVNGQATIPASRISIDDLDIGEYVCKAPTKMVVGNNTGIIYTLGEGDSAYYVYGNPLITEPTETYLHVVSLFPEYKPIQADIIIADPSVESGDMVHYLIHEEDGTVISEDAKALSEDGKVISEMDEYFLAAPLMVQTITWNAVTSATYQATGYEVRQIPEDADSYSVVCANGIADGSTTVNGNCIKVGKIESSNGKYSLNMETGYVEMGSAHITGGSIDISSSDESWDMIKLNLTNHYTEPTGGIGSEVFSSTIKPQSIEGEYTAIPSSGSTSALSYYLLDQEQAQVSFTYDDKTSSVRPVEGVYGYSGIEYRTYNTRQAYISYDASKGIATMYNFTSSSDERLKEDIENVGSVDDLKKLRPVSYKFKEGNAKHYGLIAQEVLETDFAEHTVYGSEESMYSLDYNGFVALLIKGWQDHEARISELESEIKKLKGAE